MTRYLVSADTMFWVEAESEEEACEMALFQMPKNDLEFVVLETDESGED